MSRIAVATATRELNELASLETTTVSIARVCSTCGTSDASTDALCQVCFTSVFAERCLRHEVTVTGGVCERCEQERIAAEAERVVAARREAFERQRQERLAEESRERTRVALELEAERRLKEDEARRIERKRLAAALRRADLKRRLLAPVLAAYRIVRLLVKIALYAALLWLLIGVVSLVGGALWEFAKVIGLRDGGTTAEANPADEIYYTVDRLWFRGSRRDAQRILDSLVTIGGSHPLARCSMALQDLRNGRVSNATARVASASVLNHGSAFCFDAARAIYAKRGWTRKASVMNMGSISWLQWERKHDQLEANGYTDTRRSLNGPPPENPFALAVATELRADSLTRELLALLGARRRADKILNARTAVAERLAKDLDAVRVVYATRQLGSAKQGMRVEKYMLFNQLRLAMLATHVRCVLERRPCGAADPLVEYANMFYAVNPTN